MSKKLLFHQLQNSDLLSLLEKPYDVPNCIKDNLATPLRYYQEEALRYLHYTQRVEGANYSHNHLLFHMATGSGKTLVLAAAILYYYQQHGYQNFIFFVDSNTIIEKTKENLLNPSSSKYLFSKDILEIEGNLITIKEVESFPLNPDKNTIYLKLATIHKIHDELGSYKENGVTYEDLKTHDLILLGDEAHHFNADTKSTKKQKEEAKTWERTIERILYLNPKNRLLEFTATIDLTNRELFNKYQNKVVYQYDLKQFMNDGFSKTVSLMRANDNDLDKMLDAVLLSQYRKLIAQDYGIKSFKPLVMFQSNQVKVSETKEREFNELIEGLSSDAIQKHLERKLATIVSPTSIWVKAIKYLLESPLNTLVEQIKRDFNPLHILNANRESVVNDNAILLNSLEEINNPIRAIFSVKKLNEGWDVLNLFDIVRISEKATTTKATTDSEAQLIGRGARYYPYTYENEKNYTRSFDNTTHDLVILETLHYHTINESSYIKNLRKSFDANDLLVNEDGAGQIIQAKLKEGFKSSKTYKQGKLYFNDIESTKSEHKSLMDYGISKHWDTDFIHTSIENKLDATANITDIKRVPYTLRVDSRYIQKAIQRNSFYHFNNLKIYFPYLTSIKEFISSGDYLGEVSLTVNLPEKISLKDLSPLEKLSIIERYLNLTADTIRRHYKRYKGLKQFKPLNIRDVIKDYTVVINNQNRSSENISQILVPKSTTGKSWFVYDTAILNSLEHSLIELFESFIDKLKTKYKEIYLIRNDEKTTRFKFTEFNGYRGFMPDFILYMSDADFTYQVLVEPKGKHLADYDRWKEDFMEELSRIKKPIILGEDENIKLLGFKFYTGENKLAFIEDIEKKIFDGESLTSDGLLLE